MGRKCLKGISNLLNIKRTEERLDDLGVMSEEQAKKVFDINSDKLRSNIKTVIKNPTQDHLINEIESANNMKNEGEPLSALNQLHNIAEMSLNVAPGNLDEICQEK